MSRSSVRMAPESNLETKYAKEKVNTKFKGDISPSRAGAPMHADALDAQRGYTQEIITTEAAARRKQEIETNGSDSGD